MTIYFANKEPIDLNAIAIMGVSVKAGTDTPIGFFGTGLKFAIATILRNGCEIALVCSGRRIEFSLREEEIRKEKFQRVMMNGEALGFTTQLGRKWELWQAYRELYSNALDEKGVISDKMPVGDFGTIFQITGDAFTKCHKERHSIFIGTPPILKTDAAEIHEGQLDGRYGFYRGVRAHSLQNPSLCTYNILSDLELTEDRTVKYGYMFDFHAERTIVELKDKDLLRSLLTAEKDTFEGALSYSSAGKPSDEFMEVVYNLRGTIHCNRGAIKLWEKYAEVRFIYAQATLDPYEEEMLRDAFVILKRLFVPLTRDDLMFFDELGATRVAMVRAGKIYVGKIAFSKGPQYLASTLFEEYLHRDHKISDFSRDMQDILLERLMSVTVRLSAFESASGAQAPVMESIPELLHRCRAGAAADPTEDEIPF